MSLKDHFDKAEEGFSVHTENAHKREYESALASVIMEEGEFTFPSWDELSDFQRETIREENRRYWKEMQDFGRSLAKQEE